MNKKYLCIALCVLLTGCGAKQSEDYTPEVPEAGISAAEASQQETAEDEMPGDEVSMYDDTDENISAPDASETDETVPEDIPQTADEQGGLAESQQFFDYALDGVDTQIYDDMIIQTGQVNGQDYSLTIDLQKWAQQTSVEQIVTLSELFWECYPRMYERFGDISCPPADIVLAIEDEGYAVAEMSGNFVHIHDNWLYENVTDYDCFTHELAHVIQNGWDQDYLEYSDHIERFADCCRYEYAMKNGFYNDTEWTLQTVYDEPTRESSVRFLVWLDYFYSDSSTDILRSFFRVCYDELYPTDDWDAAWQEIFTGTELEGKSIDEVWEMYTASDFAYLSSTPWGSVQSDLLSSYDIRSKIS